MGNSSAPVVVPVEGSMGTAQAELADGSVISLRRLDSDDADDVVGLYESLTDEDCYLRFFTTHPAHLKDGARSMTKHLKGQYAIGAFDSGKLLGVANYFECRPPGYAEVAVVVAHSEHLRGVGTALLLALGRVAQQHGLHHLVAEVLVENHIMLRLMADAGWPCVRHLDDTVMHVELDLRGGDVSI